MGVDERIENLVERIDTAEEISAADRQVLQDFHDRLLLLSSKYSKRRHEKLLRHGVLIAERCGGLAAALTEREAAEDIVRWIHSEYDNEETNQDYRVALKVIGRRVTEENGDEPPDALQWISSTTSSNYDPSPEPADMLDWNDDIQAMLEATQNSRDAAAIAVQFDGGFRGGEFQDLTVGDISDNPHGLQITVSGKQGKRTVTLIPSVPYLQRWLSDHPRREDQDAPLWCNLSDGSELSYNSIANMFKRPAERADVRKSVTMTNFRKSSASYLASKGMSQAHIEDHHGWVRGSDVAARYVAIFADDADRELARIHGADIPDDDSEDLAPLECPRCGQDTPREKDLCVWCGQALEPEAAERADQLDGILVDALSEADEGEMERLLTIRDRLKEDPEFRAAAIEDIASMLD